MSLEENAYDFLNQSLKHYRKTSRNIQEWPFALLHLVQSLELLLKRVLETINPILIYKDIDQPNPDRHTVSLEQALRRLENLRVPIEEKERILIAKAALKRNLVVHYKVELNKFEWKQLYAQLFEFLHFFHHKHLKSELHSHIVRENWNVEARLMEFFKQNFVIYHGIEVHKGHPKDIIRHRGQLVSPTGNKIFTESNTAMNRQGPFSSGGETFRAVIAVSSRGSITPMDATSRNVLSAMGRPWVVRVHASLSSS